MGMLSGVLVSWLYKTPRGFLPEASYAPNLSRRIRCDTTFPPRSCPTTALSRSPNAAPTGPPSIIRLNAPYSAPTPHTPPPTPPSTLTTAGCPARGPSMPGPCRSSTSSLPGRSPRTGARQPQPLHALASLGPGSGPARPSSPPRTPVAHQPGLKPELSPPCKASARRSSESRRCCG